LYTAGPFPRSVVLGDFNGDGALDIATANDGTANTVSVLLNNGDGTFKAPRNYPVGNQPVQIVAADFNGDGTLDLATANQMDNTVSILLGNGDGTFRPGVIFSVAKYPRGLTVGDFNGDGIPDLLVSCSDGYLTENADVFLGNGDGTFRESARIDYGGFVVGPQNAVVGDFNGDGIQDFVTADLGYVVSRHQGRGDGTFLPRVTYNAGHRTAQVTVADLTGNGILDVIVSGDNYGTVTVLPGNGNGTFQTAIGYDTGSAIWTEVGDFNNDGKLDLATLLSDGDTVWVRLGNGDFKFQAPQAFKVGPGPGAGATALAIGDLEGDGYPDIVVADRKFDYVAVLRNIPDANHFGLSAPATSVAGTPFSVTVAALNPLGNKDPNYTGKVHFSSSDNQANLPNDYTFTAADQGQHTFSVTLKTAGNQTVTATDTTMSSFTGKASVTVTPAAASKLSVAGFPSPVNAGSVHTFAVTALDAYGNTAPDYAGTVHFTSTDPQAVLEDNYTFQPADNGKHIFGAVLRTAGTQSITATNTATSSITGTQAGIVVNPAAADRLSLDAPASIQAGTPFPLTVTAKDPFNNTATGYRGTVHLDTSDPRAVFPPNYTYTTGDAGKHTFTVSLGTPGAQTITATDTSSGINGHATVQVIGVLFNPPVNYPVGPRPYAVAAGDFRGIGIQDLVTANYNSNTVSVLLGNGDGTFRAATPYTAGSSPIYVVVGDFNGDGNLDVATANWSAGTVSILLGNGDGTFQAPRNFAAGGLPGGMDIGDLNGDGNLDLVVADSSTADVSVLLGNGDGTFKSAVRYATGLGCRDVKIGDFNGDGIPDLAAVSQGPATLSVLLGNGDGTFQAAKSYTTGTNPTFVATADLNGDGMLDLVAADYSAGTLNVFLGNGDGTFQNAGHYAAGTNPGNIVVSDVNGDGIADLVVPNYGSGKVSVLVGNGNGSFQAPLTFNAHQGPYGVALGDFNGDGLPDLAVANGESNDVSVLLHGAVGAARPGERNPQSDRVSMAQTVAPPLPIDQMLPASFRPASCTAVTSQGSPVLAILPSGFEVSDGFSFSSGGVPHRLEFSAMQPGQRGLIGATVLSPVWTEGSWEDLLRSLLL
jgi:hypothetical protein